MVKSQMWFGVVHLSVIVANSTAAQASVRSLTSLSAMQTSAPLANNISTTGLWSCLAAIIKAVWPWITHRLKRAFDVYWHKNIWVHIAAHTSSSLGYTLNHLCVMVATCDKAVSLEALISMSKNPYLEATTCLYHTNPPPHASMPVANIHAPHILVPLLFYLSCLPVICLS